MCGIHGIISLNSDFIPTEDILKSMGDVTIHRGPDDSGSYVENGLGIGMRRLSIIDLEGGHQPLSNEDQTLWLVCNGEIYNFRELREDLKARGHQFKTGSDSEVILHLYEEYGDDFVLHLNGMFGFALWDTQRKRLIIGRDRIGIKPLYYYNDGDRLIFATEAKAILAVPGVDRAIDPVALDSYLSLGYVAAPYSLFKGIKKLPIASLMVIENQKVEIKPYWKMPSDLDIHRTETDWKQEVKETIETAVTQQMVSDVPIGAFLSGGIDSSAVVAFMAKHSSHPVKTYAIGFGGDSGGSYYNELPYAKQVSELFKTDHKEIIVKPDVVKLLPKLLWHMDEPMADTAFITTFLVAEFARQDSTVILSGVGGDELFGGYRRYLGEFYVQKYQMIPSIIRKTLISPIARHLPSDRHSQLLNLSRLAKGFILSAEKPFAERYKSYVEVFSPEQIELLRKTRSAENFDAIEEAFANTASEDPINRLFQVDSLTQLPDDLLMLTDKMTMATSLECRVPLLDQDLVELAARMPGSMKIKGRELKYILKECLHDVLPKEILYRKKRGFGAPMGSWLKNELAPLLKQVLSQKTIESRGLFNWDVVQNTIALHESNKEDHTDHLQALMNLEIWSRLYLDDVSPEDLTEELSEFTQ